MLVYSIDLGGTTIKLGLVRAVDSAEVLAARRVPAEAGRGLARSLPTLVASLAALCESAGVSQKHVVGVGMALPCLLDVERRRVVSRLTKYPDAAELDLVGWSRDELGLPLLMENDARAALLGEWRHGAGRGVDNVAMLTLGTGVGCAVILDGKPLRGANGAAGNLGGHFTIDVDGDPCLCTNVGCVETHASTWALRRELGDHADLQWLFSESAPGVVAVGAGGTEFDPETDTPAITGAASAQRAAIRARVLRGWGAAVVNLVHAYDPEIVILGGGAMGSADKILPAVRDYVGAHAWRSTAASPLEIVPADLGETAALVGLASQFDSTAQ